jgi:cellulose synthase/poly-beta-1,6-N-acetylglucosamine synthase-like glycosyltransferase
MAEIWLILCIFTIVLYLLLVVLCRYGWSLTTQNTTQETLHNISLLIPFCNESANLPSLISQLRKLDYPIGQLEILFIDDHSTDDSARILQQLVESIPFVCKILTLQKGILGKRAALKAGVETASFDHILTTDADCEPSPGWVGSMSSALHGTYRLVCGPVQIAPGKSLFHRLQELELMPVMAVTAGLAGIGQPVMANGANMLFLKEDFCRYLEEGFNPGSSGDDTWFLLYIKKKIQGSVSLHASPESIVFTAPTTDLREFIQQRRRWTAKSKHYRDPALIMLGMLIALINLLMPVTALLGFIFPEFFLWALCLLLAKTFLDLILLRPVLAFFRALRLMWLVPLLEILYPIYSTLLLLFLFRGKYTWKGRRFS